MKYLFFKETENLNNEPYKYKEDYIILNIIDYLYNHNNSSNINALISWFEENYDSIEVTEFTDFLAKFFITHDSKVYLKPVQINFYYDINYFKINFFYYVNLNSDYIESELNFILKTENHDLMKVVSIVFALVSKENFWPDDYCFYLYAKFTKYLKYNIKKMDYLLHNDNFKIDISLSKLIDSNELLNILVSHGIEKFSDLENISLINALGIIAPNVTRIFFVLNYSTHYKKIINFKTDILEYFNNLFRTGTQKDIFYRYNGICYERHTLEEVAIAYKLTRERIRQINKKVYDKIIQSTSLKDSIDIIYEIISEGKDYVTTSDIIKVLGQEASNQLFVLLEYYNINIQYSFEFEIVYDLTKNSLSSLINKECDKLNVIFEQIPENASSFTKKVIEKYYSHLEQYYKKTGVNIYDIVDKVIEEFPSGISIGSDENYNILVNKIKEKYNLKTFNVSQHALITDIMRGNVCYCDRGKIISKKFVPEVSVELLNEMVNYVKKFNHAVYYNSIFEEFKDKLIPLGVNNRYYVKGILDQYIRDKFGDLFKTKRDFITSSKTRISTTEAMKQLILNEKGVVDINTLRSHFPGVKDYVFYNIVIEFDDVVWLEYMQSFVLMRNIKLEDTIKKDITDNIEYLFKSLNTKVIKDSKLLSRIKILKPDLATKLGIFAGNFSFFSFVSFLLKDKYYFKRPYISNDKDLDLGYIPIVSSYVNTLDKFSIKMVNSFLSKIHMRGLDDTLNFMISLADRFVQISINEMWKKEVLNISDMQLKSITDILDFYLDSFGPIDTRIYNAYYEFPRLSIGWNKYLLVGIIRTYLNDKYSIENTKINYDTTDFIIRKG